LLVSASGCSAAAPDTVTGVLLADTSLDADIDRVDIAVNGKELRADFLLQPGVEDARTRTWKLRAWRGASEVDAVPSFTVSTASREAQVVRSGRLVKLRMPRSALGRLTKDVRWSAGSGALDFTPAATPQQAWLVDDPTGDHIGPHTDDLDIVRARLALHPKTLRFKVTTTAGPEAPVLRQFVLRLYGSGDGPLYTIGVRTKANAFPQSFLCEGEDLCDGHGPTAYGGGGNTADFVVPWSLLPRLPKNFTWEAGTEVDHTERQLARRP
jgi:hypothetical protein